MKKNKNKKDTQNLMRLAEGIENAFENEMHYALDSMFLEASTAIDKERIRENWGRLHSCCNLAITVSDAFASFVIKNNQCLTDDGWKLINVTAANPLALDNEAVVLYVIEKDTK